MLMRKFPVFLTIPLLLAVTLASCDDNTGDPPAEKGVVISVDKGTIIGDGMDQARFTVMYDGLDVTSSSQVCMMDLMCLAQPVFSSDEPGEYEFYATHKVGGESVKSVNTVKVTVTEGPDS